MEATRIPWLVAEGALRLLRRDLPGAWRAAELLLRRGRPRTDEALDPTEVQSARDALHSALIGQGERVVITGPRADAVFAALRSDFGGMRPATTPSEVKDARVLLSAGALESVPPSECPRQLERLASLAPTIIATLPLWPTGREAAFRYRTVRSLRTRRWWTAVALDSGLEPLLELRGRSKGIECLAFSSARGPAMKRRPRAPRRSRPVCRINDDLAQTASFPWVSASIAVALDEIGVPVSIAPTRISNSFSPARARRLEALIERRGPPRTVDSEIGWTHYWKPYRRRLGSPYPLALFAINYGFSRSDLDDFDPWIRSLVEADFPLAPISTFCRDVLVEAGVSAERVQVVPLGYTDGILEGDPAALPGARRVKVLHVTSAADLARNGSDLALSAFENAFGPEDDVTFVVRDYGSVSAQIDARVRRLVDRGYDVRYWPVFFDERQLGSFLSAFDVLLAPFRGEGFGIKLLDAMARGVPPICPCFGGPRDFLTPETAFEVPYDLVPVEAGYDYEQLALGNGPVWAQARIGGLVDALRAVLDDPEEVKARGMAARERALSGFSWRNSAAALLHILEAPQQSGPVGTPGR